MITCDTSFNTPCDLFMKVPVSLCIVSTAGEMLAINNKFIDLFEYELNDIPYISEWIAESNPLIQNREKALDRWIKKLTASVEDLVPFSCMLKSKNDKIIEVEISGTSITEGFLASILDVTEQNKNNRLISELAFYDPLTKLANRRLFYDRFTKLLAINKRNSSYNAFMVIDLNKFKPLNDIYGHLAGDNVLIEVSNRLKGAIRETDTVARFGGDEFVLLLGDATTSKDTAKDIATVIATRIYETLALPHLIKNPKTKKTDKYYCTGSIGISLFNGINNNDSDNIIHQADEAMYKAKTDKINFVFAE